MAVPFIACMALTAAVYHLPPRVLPSIQKVEGGRPGLVHKNSNGTEDLGVMQVNQIWIGPIARRVGWSGDAVHDRLLNDPCFNIAAAGAIMRTFLNETQGDLMRAVGNYHSHTPVLNLDYQVKVLGAARALFANRM
jgi:soluble lytic murein transglycosylase-like protein